MRAVVYRQYGEVLRITEIATTVPKSNEVLIEVHSTTVSSVTGAYGVSKFLKASG
jgi:NADPH:quinone reductase-like Zn-dependent oxidoreductase